MFINSSSQDLILNLHIYIQFNDIPVYYIFFLQCEPISGLGFRRGSYKCICRKGFYFPDTSLSQKYFNGSTLEEEYEKIMLVSFN